jgi:hypothetical protein
MKRRWPLALCLFCWLIILLAPPLRRMFSIQMMGGGLYSGWPYGPFKSGLFWRDKELHAPPNVKASNDVRWLAIVADESKLKFGTAFDPLIQAHPRETWLIAKRLLKTIDQIRFDRVGGELSDINLAANRAAGIPSPERSKEKPNFTRQDLEKALSLSRRGRRLEPDNAFWDWAEAFLRLADWQDDRAWHILARGSHKSRFDMHQGEWLQSLFAAHSYQLRRPLLFEEKNELSAENIFGYFARFREMARIISWQGIKAERRGDHQKALQIDSDFARLMEKGAHHSHLYISNLVLHALFDLALKGDGARPGNTEVSNSPFQKLEFEKNALIRARHFSDYAKAHGRLDLANEMTRLAVADGQREDKLRHTFESGQLYIGMPARPFLWAIIFWWTASLLLLLLPMFCFVWLLLGGALRWAQVPVISIESRILYKPVTLVIGTTALCWVVAFAMGAGWRTPFAIGWYGDVPEYMGALAIGLLACGLILPSLLADLFCKASHLTKLPGKNLLRWREMFQEVRLSTLLPVAALTSLCICAGVWWLVCLLIYDSYPSIYGYRIYISPELLEKVDVLPLIPQFVFATALFLLWFREIIATPQVQKSAVAKRLRLLHATFGALLVTASVSYLLLLAVSIPVRAAADAEMNRLIQRGEVAMMLENSR